MQIRHFDVVVELCFECIVCIYLRQVSRKHFKIFIITVKSFYI
jgi:hypothetical protein